MIKPLVCAAAVFLSAPAWADPPHWTFTYKGFQIGETPNNFDPGSEIVGTFTGEDLNHDMRIDRSELTSLKIGFIDFTNCPYSYPLIYSCNVSAFSFDMKDGLDFSLDGGFMDENSGGGASDYIVTGDYLTHSSAGLHTPVLRWSKYWTPETTLTIMAPVPEPGQYAMLGAGLLGLAGLRARRRRHERWN
jgi:hypothetical protein